MNPVRAKIVESPERYRWSSYSMYIGNEKEKVISSNRILSYFKSGKLYKKYVESEINIEVSNCK